MRRSRWTPALLVCSMMMAAVAGWALTPRLSAPAAGLPDLADLIPHAFGDWKEIANEAGAIDPRSERERDRTIDSPYDDVLLRSYGNASGNRVLVALAYGRVQRQEVKVHRPELCYVAQGFEVLVHSATRILVGPATVSGARLLVEAPGRVDAVSYWVRIGDLYSDSPWKARRYLFLEGLKGRLLDGILVRVSQTVASREAASSDVYTFQEKFLADFVRAIPEQARKLLMGGDALAAL